MSNLIIPERISLRDAGINEGIIEQKIAENPAILGLGELDLKGRQRSQPKAGRLDLLFQDPDSEKRYEVEIQLGETDESHIIRTIEYWDIERKRYPQYEHCAIIIAEKITSRFHNVIGLFNRSIPLIAIQVNAYKFGSDIGLIFAVVLDEFSNDVSDEGTGEVVDRNYWISRGTEETVGIVDRLLEIVNEFAEGYKLKYNQFYIGLEKDGRVNNFVHFSPKKSGTNIYIQLPFSEETQNKMEQNGLHFVNYRGNRYFLRIGSINEVNEKSPILKEIFHQAYENSK